MTPLNRPPHTTDNHEILDSGAKAAAGRKRILILEVARPTLLYLLAFETALVIDENGSQMTSHNCVPSPAKKAKTTTSWRSWKGELEANNGKRFGLQDLLPGFTLRLEHRQGGTLATHRGEERM